MRKFTLLVAGVLLSVGVLAACVGGPPPPPPTDPHDVLVVGDSVSFSLGCVLGDGGGTPGCPARPGYTTVNEYTGGCTISPGTLELYNGGNASAPNCDTAPDQFGRTWQQAAALFVPKVVVINTAGWEIVDRYIQCPPYCSGAPDNEWGVPTSDPRYTAARDYYANELYNAINMFRSYGAKVVVANSPYIQPHQPEPPPATVPAGLGCSWWETEPFNTNPPTAVGDPNNPLTCPGTWQSPDGVSSYRSSKTKLDQFNDIVTNYVKGQFFGGDPNVRVFNFAKHFNPGGAYNDYVCPPPDDSTQVPGPDVDLDGTPNCPTVQDPLRDAILARAVDHSHLSPAGQFQILQPYLEPCVLGMAGFGGGDLSKCN